MKQISIRATYMRGGTSKGLFFNLTDLPHHAQTAGQVRDTLLLRIIGSPDPYSKHTDGMGGATSSTSKTVIVSQSANADHDVNYLFGQVAIDRAVIDWSGNCGNVTSAVGAFAIENGLVDVDRVPDNGICEVRIWQENIQKTIIAHVPITDGEVQETGDFELDGVTFPSAQVQIDFISPIDGDSLMFPTGNLVDELALPDIGNISVTMINAGIPTIFVNAHDIGYTGTELQSDINNDAQALQMFETIRAYGAVKMGLISDISEAQNRQHTPKVAFVSPASTYVASSGRQVYAHQIDLNVRAVSMGQLHHAMMGTAAVAIASAAAIPHTLVNIACGGGIGNSVVFGHPSGTFKVGANAECIDGQWHVDKVTMSRSARRLMVGSVFVPQSYCS